MKTKGQKNTWVLKSEEHVFTTPIMNLFKQNRVASEDGRGHPFYVLKTNDWCNIIPITSEGKVVMIKQFRVGSETETLEIPGGVVDDSDTDLKSSALRELLEETGYAPTTKARCDKLGWSYSNPAIINNKVHSFIVGPVEKMTNQNLDHGEMIEIVELELDELVDKITLFEIDHALILNAFFFSILKDNHFKDLLKGALKIYSK